ncbi:DUF4886 domain-containing protein [Clostridium sp. HBUAS56010]|uniref:DUF4886 domain-containing protein n=1 Tax=Clostridium sp. HBUAS56010 TaxID=2571127 RepID=UPI0011786963|nr:DUF4886 domain-containing protein [Clostridium sp. HBUAS56010]
MKKSIVLKVIIGIIILLCALFGGLYYWFFNMISGGKVQAMDFGQELNLKKPAEIKTDPTVLFIGNSMTYSNQLPGVFAQLSMSGGFNPDVYELTEGYYTLQEFADPQDELGAQAYEALSDHTWDYVVMQENTGMALVGDTIMLSAVETLDELVRRAGGESVLFMTWAHKDGFSHKILGINNKNTREEMQTRMAQNYLNAAEELDLLTAPAGIAFMRCAQAYPEIELWDEDKSHPSLEGTYLAACVLYQTLFDQTPEGVAYSADLDGDTVFKLQQIAGGMN